MSLLPSREAIQVTINANRARAEARRAVEQAEAQRRIEAAVRGNR